jgi:hypothetical protein
MLYLIGSPPLSGIGQIICLSALLLCPVRPWASFAPSTQQEASLAGEQSACRSQIKLIYGSHHQQPQKDCRYDELDPYLVVREPSMRMIEPIHGQASYRLPCSPEPNTLSHPTIFITSNDL